MATSYSSYDLVFRDRSYKSREIPNIPREFVSPTGRTMSLDYARRSEVTSSLLEMLKMSSERGDNVGVDEFEFLADGGNSQLMLTDQLIKYSTIFTVWLITTRPFI